MKLNLYKLFIVAFAVLQISCGSAQEKENAKEQNKSPNNMAEKINKTDEEWKQELTDEEYRVLRQKGTERAFTGELLNNKEKGTYVCAGCGTPLFKSETKFDSGSGWPSFYDEIDGNVEEDKDTSFGMTRTEILCAKCGGHLGHVFDDGPKPTGLRYCVNSVSLDFKKEE